MRVAVLASLPRPVVLPEDFLPCYLQHAGIHVAAIIARHIPLLQAWRAQARTADRGARVLEAIRRAWRSPMRSVTRQPAQGARRIPIHYVVDHNSPSCAAFLRGLDLDLLVLGGTGIIRRHILQIPRLGSLGCHYGLLPTFRGVNVTEWAVFLDEPVGVSVYWVDPGVDTGEIVLRRQIPVTPGDTVARLRRKSADEGKVLLVDAIRMIVEGTAPRIPQRPEDGKRYYAMHPRLRRLVEKKLANSRYPCQPGGPVAVESWAPVMCQEPAGLAGENPGASGRAAHLNARPGPCAL